MGNDNLSENKQVTREKSKQTKKNDKDQWTFGRSVLFLLITFDLVAVLAWLIYYHSYYETVSKIVGGVWAAVLTFLSYMKIKRPEENPSYSFCRSCPSKWSLLLIQ